MDYIAKITTMEDQLLKRRVQRDLILQAQHHPARYVKQANTSTRQVRLVASRVKLVIRPFLQMAKQLVLLAQRVRIRVQVQSRAPVRQQALMCPTMLPQVKLLVLRGRIPAKQDKHNANCAIVVCLLATRIREAGLKVVLNVLHT